MYKLRLIVATTKEVETGKGHNAMMAFKQARFL